MEVARVHSLSMPEMYMPHDDVLDDTFESAIAAYKEARLRGGLTQQQMLEHDDRVWNLAPSHMKTGKHRKALLFELVGGQNAHEYYCRNRLRGLSKLFEMMERGAGPSTVVVLADKARRYAKAKDITPEAALDVVLEAREKGGMVEEPASLEDGVPMLIIDGRRLAFPIAERVQRNEISAQVGGRLMTAARRFVEERGVAFSEAVVVVLEDYDKTPKVVGTDGKRRRVNTIGHLPAALRPASVKRPGRRQPASSDRGKWSDVRNAVRALVIPKLGNVDEILMERLWREFQGDLKTLMKEWSSRLSRTLREAKDAAHVAKGVTRRQIENACQELVLDPPAHGEPIDMIKASRQKKLLCRAYHPDTNKGSAATTDKYQAVLDAFVVIRQYAEEHGKQAKTSRVSVMDAAALADKISREGNDAKA